MTLVRFVEHDAPDQLIDGIEVSCPPRVGELVIFHVGGDRSAYRVAAVEHFYTVTYDLETETVIEIRCRLARLGDTKESPGLR